MKKNCSTCAYWQGTDQSYTEWCTEVSARVPFDYGCSQYMARPTPRDYNNSRGVTGGGTGHDLIIEEWKRLRDMGMFE